jgi:hypothetical protein
MHVHIFLFISGRMEHSGGNNQVVVFWWSDVLKSASRAMTRKFQGFFSELGHFRSLWKKSKPMR